MAGFVSNDSIRNESCHSSYIHKAMYIQLEAFTPIIIERLGVHVFHPISRFLLLKMYMDWNKNNNASNLHSLDCSVGTNDYYI